MNVCKQSFEQIKDYITVLNDHTRIRAILKGLNDKKNNI